MTTNELNHLKGLAETAIHNANNAENKSNAMENSISDAWNKDEFYKAGRFIIDNNTVYEALFDNVGLKPSENPIYWKGISLAEILTQIINKINTL